MLGVRLSQVPQLYPLLEYQARALWTSHPPLNSAGDWWPPGKAEEEVQSAAGSGAHESQRCRQETHTATEILGH